MIYVENAEGKTIPIDETRAAYRVLAIHGFFGPNDHLFGEGSIVYFDGEPNEDMEALTPIAHDRLVNHLETLDKLGREAAAKAGKAYAGRARTLDGALAMATAIQRAEMGLMGNKNKDTSSIEDATEAATAETGTYNPKKARGRPRKDQTVQAA